MRNSSDVVLITGATGGMGSSHARGYYAEGARVVITGTRDDIGRALAEELGERAIYIPLDVTDPADWARAVAEVEARFGPVTVLVNNAGVMTPAATIDMTDPAHWRVPLRSTPPARSSGIRAVAPSLRRAGGGSIVNIVSTMGNVGSAGFAPYVAQVGAPGADPHCRP